MNISELAYRLMLRAYPRGFREVYAREMVLCFRDQRRDGIARGAGYWLALGADVLKSAPREWNERFTEVLHTGELFMKAMAGLAAFVGAFQGYNALREATAASAGGFLNRDGITQADLSLAIIASLLMIVAGIALWRGGRNAIRVARVVAAATICVFVLIRLTSPMLSMLAMLLGTVFPLGMLAYLFMSRNDDSARPAMS